ncbi:MAG: hypothetical protein JWM73_2605, partial [Solirubrobacterales bacterium]|nr:hypothetical protein [Solirubrobacterales bacterium]
DTPGGGGTGSGTHVPAGPHAPSAASDAVGAVQDTAAGVTDAAGQAVDDTVSQVTDTASGAVDTVTATAQDTVDDVTDVITGALPKLP